MTNFTLCNPSSLFWTESRYEIGLALKELPAVTLLGCLDTHIAVGLCEFPGISYKRTKNFILGLFVAGGFHQLLKFWKYSILPECESSASDDYFIDRKCSGRCRSVGGGSGVGCVSLCLPGALGCLPHPRRGKTILLSPDGPGKKMFLQAREMCGKDRAL